MKKFLVPLVIILMGLAGYFYFDKTSRAERENEQEVHYHAGFLVYIDGKKEDFTDFKYMHLKPCTNESKTKKKTAAEIQLDRAHLHDGVGDVVHVHEKGAVWADLFKNIGFMLPDKELKAYIKSESVADILSAEITPYESIIITLGAAKDVNLDQYITYDHIREVEQKSESCGT